MRVAALLLLLMLALPANAAVVEQAIRYQHEDETFTGYLYYDDASDAPRPGILLVHEWWGLNDYAKRRARMLAELGYAAFAVDMYGEGRVTDQTSQASEWMSEVTADVEDWRDRALEGLQRLKASPLVDGDRLAAIGYCFGGGTVLQLAYANAPLRGVVSFHGSLPAAPEEAQGEIGPKILVLHGNADSFVSAAVVDNFRAKLEQAGANWEMVFYGGSRHGYTNPDAGRYRIANLKYDASADRRSWARMQGFFDELFGQQTGH